MLTVDQLPTDWADAVLVGRMQTADGPPPVVGRGGRVVDVSRAGPTTAELLSLPAPAEIGGADLGALERLEFAEAWTGARTPRLLSPLDLQCVKAAGVTFAVSTMERVIEEKARGDAS